MLRKLLKYDIRSIYKTWLALSVLSVLMSVFGGFCGPHSTDPGDFQGFFVFGSIISVLVIGCAVIAPFVLSLYRFYNNLYTDEGYLTFTLPVKKQDILLSKFLFSLITLVAGVLVGVIDALIYVGIGNAFASPNEGMGPITVSPSGILYALLIFSILLFSSIAAILFVFIMISLASRFSKVGRGIFALAIIYGGGIILSSLLAPILSLMDGSTVRWADILPPEVAGAATLLLLCAISAFMAMVATVLYIIEYYLLDKRLNLA